MATIKKGSYRWNDSIDFSGNPSKILINILVKPAPIINQTEMTITADSSTSVRLGVITPLTSGVANREYALTYQEKEYATVSYYVYDSLYGWNAAVGQFTEMGFTVDSAFNGFGKEFEVEEDTEVDETVGTWFEANTEAVGNTPAVEITYKGEKIELSAGQTATLHIKDHKLTEDLVVRANEVAIPETSDSPLPIEVATEAEMTALLETAEVGSVYKFTGTSETYETDALYVVEESE